MLRFSVLFIILVVSTSFARRHQPASDSSLVANSLKTKFQAKSVTVIMDSSDCVGFVAKVTTKDGTINIIVGGIGKSQSDDIARDKASLSASWAAVKFLQGIFATSKKPEKMTISTAFAGKGELMFETSDKYIALNLLDIEKVRQ